MSSLNVGAKEWVPGAVKKLNVEANEFKPGAAPPQQLPQPQPVMGQPSGAYAYGPDGMIPQVPMNAHFLPPGGRVTPPIIFGPPGAVAMPQNAIYGYPPMQPGFIPNYGPMPHYIMPHIIGPNGALMAPPPMHQQGPNMSNNSGGHRSSMNRGRRNDSRSGPINSQNRSGSFDQNSQSRNDASSNSEPNRSEGSTPVGEITVAASNGGPESESKPAAGAAEKIDGNSSTIVAHDQKSQPDTQPVIEIVFGTCEPVGVEVNAITPSPVVAELSVESTVSIAAVTDVPQVVGKSATDTSEEPNSVSSSALTAEATEQQKSDTLVHTESSAIAVLGTEAIVESTAKLTISVDTTVAESVDTAPYTVPLSADIHNPATDIVTPTPIPKSTDTSLMPPPTGTLQLSQPKPQPSSGVNLRPRGAGGLDRPDNGADRTLAPIRPVSASPGVASEDGWRRTTTPDLSAPSSAPKASPSGTSSWERGIGLNKSASGSAKEKGSADSNVKRYDKISLLALFVKDPNVPKELQDAYPLSLLFHRPPLSDVKVTTPGSVGASPRKGGKQLRFEGTQRSESQRSFEEGQYASPHNAPDEPSLFATAPPTNVFRFDPSKRTDDSTPEGKLSKATAILNKLTIEKFEKLSVDFMNIGLDSEDLLKTAVDLIVKKAQMEEHLCAMYASLCKTLTENWSKNASVENEQLGQTFRNVLLRRCEEEFSMDREAAFERIRQLELSDEDKELKYIALRKSYTGHMRFIGEIYLRELVKAKIMHLCIKELLESNEEEKWTCMCKLLQTIGSTLEEYDVSKKKRTTKDYFDKIAKLADDSSLSSRVRFMFKDLIEMRKNKWVARRVVEVAQAQSVLRAGETGNLALPGATAAAALANNKSLSGRAPGVQDARAQQTAPPQPPPENEWQEVATKGRKGGGGGSGKASSAGPSRDPLGSGRVGNDSKSYSSNSSSSASRGMGGFAVLLSSPKKSGSSKEKGTEKVSKKSASASGTASKKVTEAAGSGAEKEGLQLQTADEDLADEPVTDRLESDDAEQSSPSVAAAAVLGEKLDSQTMAKHVKASIDEYLSNAVLDDAIADVVATFPPIQRDDFLQHVLVYAVQKKDKDRDLITNLIDALISGSAGKVPVVTNSHIEVGFSEFLNNFDDILIDAPLALSFVSKMLGKWSVTSDAFLQTIAKLPEENLFAMSPSVAELVVHTVSVVASHTTVDQAKAVFNLMGFALADKVFPGPRQSPEDAVKELLEKYDATYLVA